MKKNIMKKYEKYYEKNMKNIMKFLIKVEIRCNLFMIKDSFLLRIKFKYAFKC